MANATLTGAIIKHTNFYNSTLANVDLSGMDLTGTILDCLSTPIRCQEIFIDTNLQNTNLTDASFVSADLTKIKNKSLAGADLSGASFAYSNLSDVNMSNVILDATNFWKADLTGQGLTVIYDVNTLLYHFNNLIQKIF